MISQLPEKEKQAELMEPFLKSQYPKLIVYLLPKNTS
jgi:hypothetical protein